MPTLYVANFDFDDRLAKPALSSLPAKLRAVNERLARVLLSLCEPGDAVEFVGDDVPDVGRFDRVELWGVEPRALAWLRSLGLRPGVLDGLPDPAPARAVNGRRWQFAAEGELGVRPARSAVCETPGELAAALAAITGRWVVKQEFGGSGRDVRFGEGPLTGPAANWAANRLASGPLFAEPWVRFEAEFSAHFTLTGDNAIFEGVCRLRSTPGGQFHSVEPTDLAPPLAAALPVWEAFAGRALAAGYRGPLGIDAGFAGGRVVRPVMDVNARWTMGRVALATGRAVGNPL